MGVVRKIALIEGGLEGLIMGVTEEAIEFPSLSGSLDFFLGKVSGLMRDAEREDGGARLQEKVPVYLKFRWERRLQEKDSHS
jgi:hypothetical protein